MTNARMPTPTTALDYEGTIVTAVELSARSWLVGAQVAGVARQCRQKLAPSATALLEHLDHLRQRAGRAGKRVGRVVVAYEAGRDGFWLARWLLEHGLEVYVIQPSSVPVDRRARRAKTDVLDVEERADRRAGPRRHGPGQGAGQAHQPAAHPGGDAGEDG